MRKRKSYFYKFLQYFLLTLCIPLFTVLVLFGQSVGTVRRQILTSNKSILNQFFCMVDTVAGEMSEVCVALASNQECRNYAYYARHDPDRALYQTVVAKDALANYMRDIYTDVFVCFPENERIISGINASLSVRYYYDTYYGKGEQTDGLWEDFCEVIACDSRRATFYSMTRENGEAYLCMAMRQLEYRDKESGYVVVVVLKPDYIGQLMERGKENVGGSILMFDRKGELLLPNSGGREWQLPVPGQTEEPFRMVHDGDSYMMQMRESEVTDAYYVSAVPSKYFWQQLSQLAMVSGICIAVSCIVSVFVAYLNTKRIYLPVGNVVNHLQQKADIGYNEREDTEFEYIARLFEWQEEERKKMRQTLRKSEHISRDRFLLSLLDGSMPADWAESGELEKFGVALPYDYFLVVFLKVETEPMPELFSFIIQNVFEELCNRSGRGYVVPGDKATLFLLINLREADEISKVREFLSEGLDFLAQHYQLVLTAATGGIHAGADEIVEACDEAAEAMRYRYLQGTGGIIEYERIRGRVFEPVSFQNFRMAKRITDYLEGHGLEQPPERFIEEVLEVQGIHTEISMETMECFRFELASVMNGILTSRGYSSAERGKRIQALLSESTLKKLTENCVCLLGELCRQDQWSESQKDICERAREYIRERFPDPDLSITTLGEAVGLSGPYLARQFRARFSISVLQDISQVRIAHAKQKLLHTKKSIRVISEECGFLSSNVFIKSFKKQEGITPGAFRELAEKEKAEMSDKSGKQDENDAV